MSENTRVGIGALKDRRIVQADRRLAAMFGYEAQEFIGLDACSMCSLHTSGDAAGQAGGVVYDVPADTQLVALDVRELQAVR